MLRLAVQNPPLEKEEMKCGGLKTSATIDSHDCSCINARSGNGRYIYATAEDVKYFEDSILVFKWAFKKLPKSIPKALKKDLGLWLD
jgi:hypothetical protein